MSNERTQGYAEAIVALSRGEGALDAVEGELLTLARTIDGNEELRRQLTDRQLPVAQRLTFVDAGVLAAAHPATRAVLALLITAERIGDVAEIAEDVASRAAASRDEEVAEVVVAVPLDDARKEALKAALERVTGRRIDLHVVVDESLVGGVRARVGDTVIDGSLLKRLTDLRTRVGA